MSSNDSTPNNETVSLEDLIRETAPSGPPIEEGVGNVDKLLEIEDPDFAAQLKVLKADGASGARDAVVALDSDIDTILAQEKADKAAKGWRRLRFRLIVAPTRKLNRAISSLKSLKPWLVVSVWPSLKNAAASSATGFKSGSKFCIKKIKSGSGWYRKLPFVSKILFLMVIVFAAASFVMVKAALHGSFLPSLKRDFLVSFEPIADHSFTIGKGEAWEDLNDPLLHPEHIVLIERLVVNLKPIGDSVDPMAMIDLYIEAGSQEAAVELKDRDAAVRDMALRTMEQMTFEDLSTESGKTKLKVFLRKNLNDMMSRGRIHRVYYKSMVLKP